MNEPWLVKPENIKILWRVLIAILVLVVVPDFFIEHHPHFGIDGTFGFGAWYGFLSCVVLVLFAKLLGAFIKRPDDYYDD